MRGHPQHGIDVYHEIAPHAKKAARVQQLLQFVQRVVYKMLFAAGVQCLRDAVGAVKTGDIVGAQHLKMLARLHHEALFVLARTEIPGQRGKIGQGCRATLFHFVKRRGQFFRINGFEQVVYGVHPESLEGILIESGGKNDGRGYFHLLENVETEAVGYLDEK